MKSIKSYRRLFLLALALVLAFSTAANSLVLAQSRRTPPTTDQKKNKRPTEGEKTDEQKPEPLPPDIINAKPQEAEKVVVSTNLVNVDAVVYNKKTGQPALDLKQANFAVFVDGVKKDITNFATPEAPITVTLVVEYSKTAEFLGYYGSGGQEYGQMEVIRPTAMFLSQFIKPEDFLSVIAFDLRPTPLTDFTKDPNRIQQGISLLLGKQTAFPENNLFRRLEHDCVR